MQQFMAMILGMELFVVCVSGSIFFIGTELGIDAITNRSIVTEDAATGAESMQNLNSTFTTSAADYQTNPFNSLLVFGDFGRAITNFMSIISGGYLFTLMSVLGIFPQSFILQVQIIFGIGVIFTLIYLASGRG